MRLEKIKLVGFKSFVDPTTVEFSSQVMGVVGPNGCGKSNIIDAVRWVMGESSAKNLRGESLTDVIFNGTVDRKPVGQASIELVFDNREGKLGGEYAKYAQIAIKRQVNRDAQSSYFLNGTKCRRRDIVDVFLGTGLSPRSYSIIEQGMISRLIEAKPEELRVHLEEVSGISKYKDRRRETENRIRHTRDNLSRINDLREEIEKQLEKLKRQASAAERYKVLKAEERVLRGQELALRWREYNGQIAKVSEQLQAEETQLQAKAAEHQHIETEMVKTREQQHDLRETYNEVQGRYYSIGSEISRMEQSIQHYKERQQQLRLDLEQAETNWQSTEAHYTQDQERLTELTSAQTELEPQVAELKQQVEAAKETFDSIQQRVQQWQQAWDEFNETSAKSARLADVEQTRIQHIEQGQLDTTRRLETIKLERSQLSITEPEGQLARLQEEQLQASEALAQCEQSLEQATQAIKTKQTEGQEAGRLLDQSRSELQTTKGRLASLEALQQEALGKKDVKANDWLVANQLNEASRLAELLQVESGWERAVELVLSGYLEAVCTEQQLGDLAQGLNQAEGIDLTVVLPQCVASTTNKSAYTSLADKVSGSVAAQGLLNAVYVADDLSQALEIAKHLASHESVICQDGTWLGCAWLRVAKDTDLKSGTLLREQEIKNCQQTIAQLEAAVQAGEEQRARLSDELAELELTRDAALQGLNEKRALHADLKAKMSVKQAQIEQVRKRLARLEEEAVQLQQQHSQAADELVTARSGWQAAMVTMESDAEQRERLLGERESNREQLEQAQAKLRDCRDQLHQHEIQFRTNQSQLDGLQNSLERLATQRESLRSRREQLSAQLSDGGSPIEATQEELASALERRVNVEAELKQAKQQLDESEHVTRELEQARHQIEQATEVLRNGLESKRLRVQEVTVRCDTMLEQLAELEFELETVLAELTEEHTKSAVSEELNKVVTRIQRLGAINLAAIDEYKVQAERKEYLDAQHADVESALTTLENVIRKIDKETRAKFKETFEKVNSHFQSYFPRVFGGGSARLEMTGDDLLTTGVMVIARPPGKKNSTIHLLSGGEKALTAISLVFSLFQLNPAPFCMLDEVDAPLDDANVVRYCNLVKEISKQVQVIFISHNKVAIEMGQHLVGVTMHEPGVSRIVSVDVDEAVALAEEA